MTEITKVDMESEEYQRMLSDYSDYASTFASGFITQLFSKGIINEIDAEQLKTYFANPDQHQKEIEDLAQYYYISSGEIHQLYELIEALPTLNYKIDSFEKDKKQDKFNGMINKALHKVKHKRLTRDLLKQTTTAGTLVGIWLGSKSNPYPYIFDDIKHIFPADRKNGEWRCVIDMNWFKGMDKEYRDSQISNLSPYVTKKDYEDFEKDSNKKYIYLPQDRTFVLQTGKLKRNQGLGTSWVTPGMYDVLHKKKLKDVESSIANKIINAVAVLTIGHIGTNEKNNEYANMKLPKGVKQKVHSGVKAALEKNQSNGVTVVSIPDYAKIEFPDVKSDGLDGKKFEHINGDIQTSYGLSGSILNGSGGNFAASKMNLDTLYKRIGVLLEDIEQEVYQKLINIILPASQKDNSYIVYDKETPLTLKEKVDILSKMNDKGWSTKHIVDMLPGISWESYLEQTLHETEVLQLQSKITPYKSTHTTSNEESGRPPDDDSLNDNTQKSKDSNGNNTPS